MRNILGKGLSSWGMMVLLLVVPLVFYYTGNAFYLDLATRLVILAIAAVGLNFVLGFGGLISFGHAAFLGLGAYAVGIPAYHEIYGGWDAVASTNGFFHFGLAIGVGALFALFTGAISLKVKGVHFIMITMAFAQMIYYLIMSIEEYGGDDGLVIDMRSEFPLISLDDPIQFFLIAFTSLALIMWLVHLMVNSRFGMVLRGSKGNEARMVSIGYPTYRYRLVAYVISGAICGYAGALLGNFTAFISPEMMDWSRSGNLMFMVTLGGVATIFGPVWGAIAFIVLEEILSGYTIYWHLPFGLMLVLVVMFSRGGISALLRGKEEPVYQEPETMEIPLYVVQPSAEHTKFHDYVRRFRLNPSSLLYDLKDERVVFPILYKGRVIDAAGRAVGGKQPKWYRYTGKASYYMRGTSKTLLIVEDCVSAMVAQLEVPSLSAMAILGTSLSASHYERIAEYDRVIVALDPDAAHKTLQYTREIAAWTGLPTTALRLDDDIKYRLDDDLDKLKEVASQ